MGPRKRRRRPRPAPLSIAQVTSSHPISHKYTYTEQSTIQRSYEAFKFCNSVVPVLYLNLLMAIWSLSRYCVSKYTIFVTWGHNNKRLREDFKRENPKQHEGGLLQRNQLQHEDWFLQRDFNYNTGIGFCRETKINYNTGIGFCRERKINYNTGIGFCREISITTQGLVSAEGFQLQHGFTPSFVLPLSSFHQRFLAMGWKWK